MRCSYCGGFYNERCDHWPQCSPLVEDDKAERMIDFGFRAFFAMMSGANFTVLVLIWLKL